MKKELSNENNKMSVNLLAVQTAKSICIESKKKNMTRSETDAPNGKQIACVVSSVAKPESIPRKSFKNNEISHSTVHTCIVRNRLASQQIVGAFALSFLFLLASFLFHIEATETAIDDEEDGDEAC